MTYQEHILAAETFLQGEKLLSELGMTMLAAEAVWGAVIQVLDAVNHQIGSRHTSNNQERQLIIAYLESKYGFDNLIDDFKNVINRLHNHFYTGRLSDMDAYLSAKAGVHFVNLMIELAKREDADN